jgi:uncharacterized protein (TIGR02271 family)
MANTTGQMNQDTQRVAAWRGRTAVDNDGDKIGEIKEIYLDRQSGQPQWALVSTGLLKGQSFVPLQGATDEGADSVRFPYEKSLIKDAPSIDADQELSPEEEQTLYRHYNVEWGECDYDRDYDSGRDRGTVGRDTSGPTTDDAMTRSEEELAVGKTSRESGRARLRKYVVTEQVQTTVPVQREEVRVEREPITDANVGDAMDGPAISDEEHEVVLHEEEAVVDKRAVPKERVRLDKQTVTEEKQVSDEVRKERIEVEGDDRKRGR